MDSILQSIEDWFRGLLVSGIMDNLSNTFESVNNQVGQIATEVGQTPANFSPAVYNMIRTLSENVIMPIAGVILTFIACYELIQLVISHNNLANFETWIFWKWIFKTFVAVTLITNTMNITMAVFDVAQHVVTQAGGIIAGSTAIDDSTLATVQSTLEAMEIGPLLSIFLQTIIVRFLIYILSALIFVIVYARMIEIYLMVSLAPIPFSTFGNVLTYTIVRSAVRYKENNPWTGVWSGDYMVEETYNPNSKYHKNLVIAESLSVIENVLLFSISNYFRKFSMEYKAVHQVENFDNDWYEYVEYGTTNPITIFLQQNGFSREASIYIQTPSNYSKYVTDVDGEKKIKRSILECGNIGVETEAQDIQFNIPELFVE